MEAFESGNISRSDKCTGSRSLILYYMARSKPPKQSFAKDSRTAGASNDALLVAFHHSLPLFASAILSLDSWHIRITDPTTSASRNEYALDKGQVCRCLAWGTVSKKGEKSKKKRKVEEKSDEGILGAGSNDGTIHLFNPSEDSPIAKLEGGHTGEVLSLCFTDNSVWSAGSDGKAVEWDISSRTILQTIVIDSSNALRTVAFSSPTLLAASYTIHQLKLPNTETQHSYTNHTSPVHSLIFGPESRFVSAAEDDRYMNIISADNSVQERSLVAESDIRRISYLDDILGAVTVDGTIELFANPFAAVTSSSNKRRKSQVTSSKSKVQVVRPDGTLVQVSDVSIRKDNAMIMAWSEGARMVFETIQLKDDQGAMIDSTELVRAKQPMMGATNGVKEKSSRTYRDGEAQIAAGNDAGDLEMVDDLQNNIDDEDSDEEPTEEPTLADRLLSMEVSAATPAKAPASSKTILKMPSAGSLTTVLTQALKSNDTALLESCLHHSESKIILASVRRLDATLAVVLLEQIASRIARRPGRSADLGMWVRWTIVVHGGYLASLPGLVRTLSSLHGVLATRAATLPRLLALQGRLDMVHSQIELRREGGLKSATGEDPSDVEYIEGESDLSDEEEIGIEDASQLGGLDTSDEDSDGEEASDGEGEFSDDSGDGNEFADLDATMEMLQEEDEADDDDNISGASDDEA